jgi:imidazole glycerol-phosphate synthase subunit HisH
MIAIVDYGSGNVAALANIYQQLKIPHQVTADPRQLEMADRYILPGVGSFDPTMQQLKHSGIMQLLNEQVLGQKKQILGICVGMQILADSSEEGSMSGLGWIPGCVRKLDQSLLASKPLLPHMGWNSIQLQRGTALLADVDLQQGFYFLHSYFFDAKESGDVVSTVNYGRDFASSLSRSNVHGMQFHPEKSHSNGVTVLRNFAAL